CQETVAGKRASGRGGAPNTEEAKAEYARFRACAQAIGQRDLFTGKTRRCSCGYHDEPEPSAPENPLPPPIGHIASEVPDGRGSLDPDEATILSKAENPFMKAAMSIPDDEPGLPAASSQSGWSSCPHYQRKAWQKIFKAAGRTYLSYQECQWVYPPRPKLSSVPDPDLLALKGLFVFNPDPSTFVCPGCDQRGVMNRRGFGTLKNFISSGFRGYIMGMGVACVRGRLASRGRVEGFDSATRRIRIGGG
ncbi:hypothetical protein FOZ60_000554, partial [Perkinsus olseni]